MKILTLLVGLLAVASSFNFFSLNYLPTKNGAMCLDGSPAALYIYEPDDISKAANKILIMFEWTPNGWCFKQDLSSSLNDCLKFANNDFGSSKNYESNFLPMGGILAPSVPGPFANWYKVLIKSCDGGSYLGNREPISIKTQKLHFRGSKIVEETINYLNNKGWLMNREEVVLAGTFNAGVAALQWSEVFQKNTKATVKIISDAAYYLNEQNPQHGQSIIEERMRSISKIALENTTLPHSKCRDAYPDELWNCFFLQQLAPLSDLPIFLSQSLYDGFHIEEVLGFDCAELFDSLSECSKKDKEIIDEYHTKVVQNIKVTASSNPKFSAFGIACVVHELLGGKYSSQLYEVPMNSGNQLYKGIEGWLAGNGSNWIDEIEWPHNSPCSKKTSPHLREN